jgi:hypothetical protein
MFSAFTVGIFGAGLLAGTAVALFASMVSDLPQVLTDLRQRHARRPDNSGDLAMERAISRRLVRSITLLGSVVLIISTVVLLSLFLSA